MNTRRGIRRLTWIISGIVAVVLLALLWWIVLPIPPVMPVMFYSGLTWSMMAIASAILVVLVFGGVWAVYGLVVFVLKVLAYWERKEITEIMDEILDSYFQGKTIKPVPRKRRG